MTLSTDTFPKLIHCTLNTCVSSHFTDIYIINISEHAVNLRDEQGMTPLMWASAYSQPQAAEMLILAGADIRLCSNDGHTALMLTAATGHEQLLNTLLAKNADINATSKVCTVTLVLLFTRVPHRKKNHLVVILKISA